jgi:hypothetical protein
MQEAEKNGKQSQQKVDMLSKDIEQLKAEIAKQKTAYQALLSEVGHLCCLNMQYRFCLASVEMY